MDLRQRSIRELKSAMVNKTLGCYNEDVFDEGACLYFHGNSGTCCAIGSIIPHEDLFKNINDDFNVKNVFHESEADPISHQLKNDVALYGLSLIELKTLQTHHDEILTTGGDFGDDNYLKRVNLLEDYIDELVLDVLNEL